MIYLLYLIHVVVSLFLILVVLLQQGKGADLSVFGGGATQTAFGARGAASLLHKLTVMGFVAFILTTISIGFMGSSGSSSSVMSNLPAPGEAVAVESEATPEPAAETVPAETDAAETATDETVDGGAEDGATEDGAEGDGSDQ